MNKVLVIIIGILAVGGVAWLAIFNRSAPDESNDQAQSEQAPDFALQDFEGQTVKLADFAGRPLVMNSWATWCPFCREELKDFAAVKAEFGGRIEIIAIDRAEPLETAKRYTDELGVTDDFIFLLDPADSFYQTIGGFSMPETIFVDADGKIVFHKRGPMSADEIRERVAKTLNPKS